MASTLVVDMRTLNDMVRDLQRAARKERVQSKRQLFREAAEWIWDYANQAEDENVPMPCPECGSHSTDCGCD